MKTQAPSPKGLKVCIIIVSILLGIAVLSICFYLYKQHQKPLNTNSTSIHGLSLEQFKNKLDENTTSKLPILVDIRTNNEVDEEGKIPNSLNVPSSAIDSFVENTTATTVFIYDESGNSEEMKKVLTSFSTKKPTIKVYYLQDTLKNWKEGNYPYTTINIESKKHPKG